MAQSEVLKIAVVGIGGIGSTFAFQLSKIGKHDVTVVARPKSKRLQQLERDKAIVTIKGERAEVQVRSELEETIAYDLVLVTLKAYQADAVLPVLKRSSAKNIQLMFNNFDPERMQAALGAERCGLGMPFVQGSIDSDGNLIYTIGAGGQKTLLNKKRWVDVFNAAGLPANLEPKMELWLRCHVPLCIAFESISVAGVRRGKGASWKEAAIVAEGLQESLKLIERAGNKLYPNAKVLLRRSPTTLIAAMFWGISRIKSFRELLASGIDECRALVDVLIAAAPAANPSVDLAKIRALKPVEISKR